MQRMPKFGGNHLQIRFPHVTTNKTHSLDDLWPQGFESAPQARLRSPFSHPQQASATGIDLINHGEKVIRPQAVSPMNFIYSDGLHPLQYAMGQTPLHKPFDGTIDRFPTGLK